MGPTRTCVGCRKALPVDVLFRVVLQADGELLVERCAPGRGAWLCQDSPGCLRAAVRQSVFGRAFGTPVATGAVERLQARLNGASEQPADDVRE